MEKQEYAIQKRGLYWWLVQKDSYGHWVGVDGSSKKSEVLRWISSLKKNKNNLIHKQLDPL